MSTATLDDDIVSPRTYAAPARCDDLFRKLRGKDPVRWTAPIGYAPFWTVTKYEDIREIEGQPETFLNAPRLILRSIAQEEQVKAVTGERPLLLRNLVNLDGAEHHRLRHLTQAWFMPARLRALESDMRALAGHSMDVLEGFGGSCDFANDVARWYPLRVIMTLLGVPASDEPKMLSLTQQIFGPDDPDVKKKAAVDLISTVEEFTEYFRALIARRRAEPTDDVASLIANASFDDRPIGELEAVSYYILIATAGHDTTTSTLAGGLLALIERPSELRKLKEDPASIGGAVDEMVRWVTPVKHFFRTAAKDYRIRGKDISAGESLMMSYVSANRDEDVFDDPYRFNAARGASRHLAFGYGPHVCLGQHLARMELRIFFEALLQRFGDFELAGEPAWLESNFVSGLKRLPLQYGAA